MSQKTRTELKTFFETGDKPTQQEFYDFLDSYYNIIDDVMPGLAHMVSGGGTDKIYDEVQLMSAGDVLMVDSGVYVENQAAGIAKQGISIYCMPNVFINRTWTTPLFDCAAITEFCFTGYSYVNCQYILFQGPGTGIAATEFIFEALEFKSTDNITFYLYSGSIDYLFIKGRLMSGASNAIFSHYCDIDVFYIIINDFCYSSVSHSVYLHGASSCNYLHINGNRLYSGSGYSLYFNCDNISTAINLCEFGIIGGFAILFSAASDVLINSNVFGVIEAVGSPTCLVVNGNTINSLIRCFGSSCVTLNGNNKNIVIDSRGEGVIVNGYTENNVSFAGGLSTSSITFNGVLKITASIGVSCNCNVFYNNTVILDADMFLSLASGSHYFYCLLIGNQDSCLLFLGASTPCSKLYINSKTIMINNSSAINSCCIFFNTDNYFTHNGGKFIVSSDGMSLNVAAGKNVSVINELDYWTNYSRGGAGIYTELLTLATGSAGGTEKVNTNLII